MLFIETERERFEVSKIAEDDMNIINEFDTYTLSKVKDPMALGNAEM